MFNQAKKSKSAPVRKLHSIHSLLTGHRFSGEIEAGKAKHTFTFSPSAATVVGGKLELTGRVAVKSAGQTHKIENAKATLLATQSGLATAPAAPKGADAAMLGSITSVGLPVTDATGARAYVGVMYLKLSTLSGHALGVPFDLSSVQLNGRLNPVDDIARTLQFWYSVAVRAIYSTSPDESLAARSVSEINRILAASGNI